MTMTVSDAHEVPQELLDYLAQHANLTWHKKIHPLPNWFNIKEAMPINALQPLQLLALLKAKAEGYVTLKLVPIWPTLWKSCKDSFAEIGHTTESSAKESWPTVEKLCRRQLLHRHKLSAEQELITTGKSDFVSILTEPVAVPGRFLIIEPGLKSGLKMACCEADGSVRSHMILFPHEPQNQWQQGIRKLENCVATNKVESIILVTGEGYRESRIFIKEWLRGTEHSIQCYRLNGSFKNQLTHLHSASDDSLYATIDAFIPLALSPGHVFEHLNHKTLFHNPLLSIVNQAKLSKALEQQWHEIKASKMAQTQAPDPLFHSNINNFSELTKHTTYVGQIVNQTDYGYFVDIGIQENGLLHSKQLNKGMIHKVGDLIDVHLLGSNPEKLQFSLTVTKTQATKTKNTPRKPRAKAKQPTNSAMADALKSALNKDNQ